MTADAASIRSSSLGCRSRRPHLNSARRDQPDSHAGHDPAACVGWPVEPRADEDPRDPVGAEDREEPAVARVREEHIKECCSEPHGKLWAPRSPCGNDHGRRPDDRPWARSGSGRGIVRRIAATVRDVIRGPGPEPRPSLHGARRACEPATPLPPTCRSAGSDGVSTRLGLSAARPGRVSRAGATGGCVVSRTDPAPSFNQASTGSGRPSQYPWPNSTPSAVRVRASSAVSTPSAISRQPAVRLKWRMPTTMA